MTLIRPSQPNDIPTITAIYTHHVLHGTGTFELEPPSASEMASRRADVLAKGLPYLVATQGERLGESVHPLRQTSRRQLLAAELAARSAPAGFQPLCLVRHRVCCLPP